MQEGLSVGVGLGVLSELMSRRLDDMRLAVMMLDGLMGTALPPVELLESPPAD